MNHVFDEEKQKKILSLYHLLVKEASFRGGKVSLDIDDETMIACLEYAGREIVFTGDKMDESAKLFSILFQMMDNGSITAKNDIFTIQAMYQLYENKKVVDRKKEIEHYMMSLTVNVALLGHFPVHFWMTYYKIGKMYDLGTVWKRHYPEVIDIN